jgi:hypothetical protein
MYTRTHSEITMEDESVCAPPGGRDDILTRGKFGHVGAFVLVPESEHNSSGNASAHLPGFMCGEDRDCEQDFGIALQNDKAWNPAPRLRMDAGRS